MKQFRILLTFVFLSSIAVNAQNYNKIIVGANNNGAVFSANIDGSNPTQLAISSSYFSFYGGVNNPTESKVYMSWYYGIYVMDYDGDNWQQLFDYPSGGMNSAIDIDIANNDLYFISTQEDILYKMNTDGSGLTIISDSIKSGSDLVLDTSNNYIYYSEQIVSSKGIYRVNMDGSGLITILPNTDVANFEIDFVNSKIYYCAGVTAYICNLDGSNSTVLFNFQVYEFAVDNNTNTLFFTDGAVKKANLDGSNIQPLVNSTDIYFGVDPLDNANGLILVYHNDVGIDDNELPKNYSIYPNPSNDYMVISGISKTENYSLYNVIGTKISNATISENEKIDIRNLTNGLYFIKFENGKTIKFIKE